jgi:hypothetical protein
MCVNLVIKDRYVKNSLKHPNPERNREMKKLSVVLLVLALLAMSVLPALAAGSPPADHGTYSGTCTGDQARQSTSNQYGQDTSNEFGQGTSNQYGLGSGEQARTGTGSLYGYGNKQTRFGIPTPYALSGTIAEVDLQAQTVTVAVACGNRLLAPYIGTNVPLQTTDSTRFLQRNADGTATPISLSDLIPGESVSSHGSLVNGVFTASRLTQGALLTCLQ